MEKIKEAGYPGAADIIISLLFAGILLTLYISGAFTEKPGEIISLLSFLCVLYSISRSIMLYKSGMPTLINFLALTVSNLSLLFLVYRLAMVLIIS